MRKTTLVLLILAIAVLLVALFGGLIGIDGLSDGNW
jgi:hypothetical protein